MEGILLVLALVLRVCLEIVGRRGSGWKLQICNAVLFFVIGVALLTDEGPDFWGLAAIATAGIYFIIGLRGSMKKNRAGEDCRVSGTQYGGHSRSE